MLMMTRISTWVLPISVSVLLHIALALFFMHQYSATPSATIEPERITVLMQTDSMRQTGATPLRKQIKRVEKKAEPPEAQPVVAEQTVNETPAVKQLQQPAATTSPAESSSQNTATTEVQPLSKLTRPPAFLHKIEPRYPDAEQRAGSQASVLAEITLDASGHLLDIKILKSAGSYFDKAVIEAIKQSTFTPGYIEQQAVAVRVLVPFRFKLK